MALFGDSRKSFDVPSSHWLNAADRVTEYTPDVAALERFEWVRIFICDEYQRDHRNYQHLTDSVYLASAFTEDKFTLWKKKLGQLTTAIPLHTEDQGPQPRWADQMRGPAIIRGELHAIRPQSLFLLDRLRENGVSFERRRVKVLLPVREEKWHSSNAGKISTTIQNVEMRAWMYVGVPGFWEPLLDGGYLFDQVKIYTPTNPQLSHYSYFSPMEYNGV